MNKKAVPFGLGKSENCSLAVGRDWVYFALVGVRETDGDQLPRVSQSLGFSTAIVYLLRQGDG